MLMELKNLNQYKFIVSSGCSYGLLTNSVFKPFNLINRTVESNKINQTLYNQYNTNWLEISDNVIVLNVSLGSQGSDWQSDSIIYVCNKLLELGVHPNNIYSLVEWSQWNRFSIHPFHNFKLDLNKFNWNRDNLFFYEDINKDNLLIRDRTISNELFNLLKIRSSVPFYNIGKISNRIYITPAVMNVKDFSNINEDYGKLIEFSKKLHDSYPIEKKIKDYLNNIIKTQNYFKSVGIKYNFHFMQSSLSNWFKSNRDSLISHTLVPPYISNTDNFSDYQLNQDFNPKNDINLDIEVVLPETKTEIDMLDMKNIWFYENEKFRRGGIDEWTIDNFKEVGYISLHEHSEEHFGPLDMICDYGAHPNTISYLTLWNKVTTNCDFVKVKPDFENFMLDKFWEDYNYDGFSKNFITISKKEWNRRLKQ
jgi:hypothetical protein